MEPFWFIVCWAKQFDIRDITISNNNQNGNWQQNDIGVHSNTMNPGNQKTDVPFIPLHRADRFTKVSKTKLIGKSGIRHLAGHLEPAGYKNSEDHWGQMKMAMIILSTYGQ